MALPFYLQGDASIWLNNLPDSDKIDYDTLTAALINNFDSKSSHWRLTTESLASYAADIHKLKQSSCLKLPPDQLLHCFVRGLRPDLKEFVILNSPDSFESALNLVQLKNSVVAPTKSTISALETQQPVDTMVKSVKSIMPTETQQLLLLPVIIALVIREIPLIIDNLSPDKTCRLSSNACNSN